MSARDEWQDLTRFTPARLALGRAGNGLPTKRVLEFQLAHARARDAVHATLDIGAVAAALAPSPVLRLQTQAHSRLDYLTNPTLGRSLDDASRAKLTSGLYDAALVIADGLSAIAIARHGAALAKIILDMTPDTRWAPLTAVFNGRVAVGDEVAEALGAEMAVVLIGERPGLTATDGIGIYLTYAPKPGITRDADRNCISNVRPEGLPLAEAAHRLHWLMQQSRQLRLSGVGLKEDAPDAAIAGTEPSAPGIS
jgi:ethanolamine ammonia-lyase small subunit